MRRRKGRGSPPIPWPSPFTAAGLRPDRSSRSGRGRRPPRRRLPAFGAGPPFAPLRGRMGGLCVQANLPAWHGAKQGADGGGTPPKRRAGRPARGPRRTDRIQCGPRRPRALSGLPWSASGGWGSGRVVPPRGTGGGGIKRPGAGGSARSISATVAAPSAVSTSTRTAPASSAARTPRRAGRPPFRPMRIARRLHLRPGTLWRQRTMSASTRRRSSGQPRSPHFRGADKSSLSDPAVLTRK